MHKAGQTSRRQQCGMANKPLSRRKEAAHTQTHQHLVSYLAKLNPFPSVRPSRSHPFTSKQFHALLNSLFKVLCNFPSRYLFAIGLAVIFSFRWSLPPALGCTLKQPDSSKQQFAHRVRQRYGPSTRYGRVLVRGTCVAET